MMRFMSLLFAASALTALPAAAATSVNVKYVFGGSVLDEQTITTPDQISYFGGNVIADIGDTSIRISNRPGCTPCNFLPSSFNGLELLFASLSFTGAGIDPSSTWSAITPDRISVNGNAVSLNFQGLEHPFPEFVLINLDSAVPEPASWSMMIAGFALAGAALRRPRVSISHA